MLCLSSWQVNLDKSFAGRKSDEKSVIKNKNEYVEFFLIVLLNSIYVCRVYAVISVLGNNQLLFL